MAINVDAMERRLGKVEQAAGVQDYRLPLFVVRYVSTDPNFVIDTARLDGTDIEIHRHPDEGEADFMERAKAEVNATHGLLFFDMRDYVEPPKPKPDPKVTAPVEDIPAPPAFRDPDYHSDW